MEETIQSPVTKKRDKKKSSKSSTKEINIHITGTGDETQIQVKVPKKAKQKKKKKQKKSANKNGTDVSKQSVEGEEKKDDDTNDENEDPVKGAADKAPLTEEEKVKIRLDNKKARRKKNRKKKFADFMLMEAVDSKPKQKVEDVVPHWMANPTIIDNNLHVEGSEIVSPETGKLHQFVADLDPRLVENLKKQGVKSLFPVQLALVPEILNCVIFRLAMLHRARDLCVSAPTGSGKTLAYVLPLLNMISKRVVPQIRVLVLLPVKELAVQVYKVFNEYARPLGIGVAIAAGNKTFAKEQEALIRKDCCGENSRVSVLVGTPGRVVEHLNSTSGFTLEFLDSLVLDEADTLMAPENNEWMDRIRQSIDSYHPPRDFTTNTVRSLTRAPPIHPQYLLFSATLPHDPEKLQQLKLHVPKLFITKSSTGSTPIEVLKTSGYTRPVELKEQFCVVPMDIKPLVLHYLIKKNNWTRTLVFTNSLAATHKLTQLLQALSDEKDAIGEFSSKLQKKRSEIFSKFKSGKIKILVASDAMARGLDISGVEQIVSYDVPASHTYVHRIGRTARAGMSGTAISLLAQNELSEFKTMLKSSGGKATQFEVEMKELRSLEKEYRKALQEVKLTQQEEARLKRRTVEKLNTGRSKAQKRSQEQQIQSPARGKKLRTH